MRTPRPPDFQRPLAAADDEGRPASGPRGLAAAGESVDDSKGAVGGCTSCLTGWPQKRLDRRLEEVAKAVGGGEGRLLNAIETGTWRQADGGSLVKQRFLGIHTRHSASEPAPASTSPSYTPLTCCGTSSSQAGFTSSTRLQPPLLHHLLSGFDLPPSGFQMESNHFFTDRCTKSKLLHKRLLFEGGLVALHPKLHRLQFRGAQGSHYSCYRKSDGHRLCPFLKRALRSIPSGPSRPRPLCVLGSGQRPAVGTGTAPESNGEARRLLVGGEATAVA